MNTAGQGGSAGAAGQGGGAASDAGSSEGAASSDAPGSGSDAADGSVADRDAAGGDAAGLDAGNAGDAGQRVVLFDGTDLNAWMSIGGGNAMWPVSAGAFEVAPGTGDIQTRQRFGDMLVHLEFWIPQTPVTNAEQDRGNSGLYIQGRYELQILDSYNHPLMDMNDCGAIYGVKDADSNQSTPPQTWQSYDVTLRAARFNGNAKTQNARVSVVWNGVEVHRDLAIPGPTGAGNPETMEPGPLRLQDHGHRVRFRNIWVQPLSLP
jgi:hypothetical protein